MAKIMGRPLLAAGMFVPVEQSASASLYGRTLIFDNNYYCAEHKIANVDTCFGTVLESQKTSCHSHDDTAIIVADTCI